MFAPSPVTGVQTTVAPQTPMTKLSEADSPISKRESCVVLTKDPAEMTYGEEVATKEKLKELLALFSYSTVSKDERCTRERSITAAGR